MLVGCRAEIGRAFMQVGRPLKDSDIQAWLNEFDADGNGIIDEVLMLPIRISRCMRRMCFDRILLSARGLKPLAY